MPSDCISDSVPEKAGTRRVHWVLFVAILVTGILARLWEIGALPPGLFADEASIGVDSYYIGHYGTDRNGVSYPTQLTAFGQEQNAFYAYLILPLIVVWGLRPAVVRLPILISAILTLPLIYWVSKRIFGARPGLLAMLFLAVNPWHILLSRWGLDQNLLPFVFTLAFAMLLESLRHGIWIIPACVLFSLCFYIYGPSYFIVPFVLGVSIWAVLRGRLIRRKLILIGIALFALIAIPISIFLIINTLGFQSLKVGAVTIPRMPATPRFLTFAGSLQTHLLADLGYNLQLFVHLIVEQTDGLIYNAFEPFGYFYKVTFPIESFGILVLARAQASKSDPKKIMLLAWLAACSIFGVLQPVNINRINTIFIPLILCAALATDWLATNYRPLYIAALAGLAIGFVWFTIEYHGEQYRTMIDSKFHAGLLEAIQYASDKTPGPVCVTDKIDMPYIYVLFVEKPDPRMVMGTIRYIDSSNPLRPVLSMTRYTFGARNCDARLLPVYLLTTDEIPPRFGKRYDYQFFDQFVVYYPKP